MFAYITATLSWIKRSMPVTKRAFIIVMLFMFATTIAMLLWSKLMIPATKQALPDRKLAKAGDNFVEEYQVGHCGNDYISVDHRGRESKFKDEIVEKYKVRHCRCDYISVAQQCLRGP